MLMDEIAGRSFPSVIPTYDDFVPELSKIKDACRWTEGFWEINNERIKWNSIQNTSSHIDVLSKHLKKLYAERT
ncbi:hypothetical protein D3C86_2213810 [compost metagenome]